jgi:hypothetical protein
MTESQQTAELKQGDRKRKHEYDVVFKTCNICQSSGSEIQFITGDSEGCWCIKCHRADRAPMRMSNILHSSCNIAFVDCAGNTHRRAAGIAVHCAGFSFTLRMMGDDQTSCWCGYPNTHYRYWLYLCIVGKQHSEHELHQISYESRCCVCDVVLHTGDVVLRCHECEVNVCVACRVNIPRKKNMTYQMWKLSLCIANQRHDLRKKQFLEHVVVECGACLKTVKREYWNCGACKVTICTACYGDEVMVKVGTQTDE